MVFACKTCNQLIVKLIIGGLEMSGLVKTPLNRDNSLVEPIFCDDNSFVTTEQVSQRSGCNVHDDLKFNQRDRSLLSKRCG